MARIVNECKTDGFTLKEVQTWIAVCDWCQEDYDVGDDPIEVLRDDGWFTNNDGQFCSEDCYNTYLILNP